MTLKSTAKLENLSRNLADNNTLAEEAAKKLDSNVSFDVFNKKGEKVKWILYAKKGKKVELTKFGNSDSQSAEESDIKIRISDLNLIKLIRGKQSAQRLFMAGKLKIKGNVLKAAYIEKLLKYAGQEKAKLWICAAGTIFSPIFF